MCVAQRARAPSALIAEHVPLSPAQPTRIAQNRHRSTTANGIVQPQRRKQCSNRIGPLVKSYLRKNLDAANQRLRQPHRPSNATPSQPTIAQDSYLKIGQSAAGTRPKTTQISTQIFGTCARARVQSAVHLRDDGARSGLMSYRPPVASCTRHSRRFHFQCRCSTSPSSRPVHFCI